MTKSKEPKTEEQKANDWLKRTAPAFKKSLKPGDVRLFRERGQNPLVDAASEVFKKAARRKIN